MNWITISSVVFATSVINYLLIRKAQLKNTPNIYINLAMVLIPAVILLFANLLLGYSLVLSLPLLVLIFFTAILFSYFGNLFSLIGIKQAPNPGYSLIISKSYVVMTSVLAIFLFKSPLTITSIIAIILIVGFSALIVLGKTTSKIKLYNKSWIIYTFGSFFCWGFLALMSKYILNQGVQVTVYLFYLLSFVSCAFILQSLIKREKYTISVKGISLLFIVGFLSGVFNLALQLGYVYAPNPGYINAVNAASISMVTISSAYFFKDELSLKKVIGVCGVLVGLLLLFI